MLGRTAAMVAFVCVAAALPSVADADGAGNGKRKAKARRLPAGEFVLAEPKQQVQQRIERAVDRAISEMNVLVRGIARGRLLDSQPIVRRVAVSLDGQEVVVELDRRRLATVRGKARRIVDKGYDSVLTQQVKHTGVVEQRFRGENGTQVTKIWLRDDGQLAVRVKVTSPRLPNDVVYTVLYRSARIANDTRRRRATGCRGRAPVSNALVDSSVRQASIRR